MIPKISITLSEVSEIPVDNWCKSGHCAPITYIRNPSKGPEPTKFFEISGSTLPKDRWGIYCEPCIIKARRHAETAKKSQSISEQIANDIWDNED